MLRSLKRRSISFKYALKGIYFAFRSQHNFQFHIVVALIVILLGIRFSISTFEWLTLVLTIFFVLVSEALNTALEIVTDALKEHKKSKRDDYLIMVGKDTAAGAVLLSAICSVAVGLIIFLPKILALT